MLYTLTEKNLRLEKVVGKSLLTAEVEVWVTCEATGTVLCLNGLGGQKCVVIGHCHAFVRNLIARSLSNMVTVALWYSKRSRCVCTLVALK